QDSQCTCRVGLTDIGGNCVDTDSDPNHCGGPSTTCSGATPACQNGNCYATCQNPDGGEQQYTNCGNACVNKDSDPLHCGDCSIQCHTNERCINGNCKTFTVPADCTMCPCASCGTQTCCSFGSQVVCVSGPFCSSD